MSSLLVALMASGSVAGTTVARPTAAPQTIGVHHSSTRESTSTLSTRRSRTPGAIRTKDVHGMREKALAIHTRDLNTRQVRASHSLESGGSLYRREPSPPR